MFALYSKETQVVRIVNVVKENFHSFITDMKNAEKNHEEFKVFFDDPSVDTSFIDTIVFDQNRRFFIGYGETKIFVLNIETQKGIIYPVSSRLY
jgi:hypothetical protein